MDMLGNPVLLGDIVFRPTIKSYEKVTQVKPYAPHDGDKTFQIGLSNLRLLGTKYEANPTWFKDGRNILKVNMMSPEIESAFALVDRDLQSFQPKLVLDFKL